MIPAAPVYAFAAVSYYTTVPVRRKRYSDFCGHDIDFLIIIYYIIKNLTVKH